MNFDRSEKKKTSIQLCTTLSMTAMGKEASLDGLEFDGDTVLCRVCGDKASGFHYGVHACEGCKGFFRRSIQQKIQYRPCLKNQQCNIMRVNRNRCQYCRLKKCISVGMSRDAVRFGRVPKKEKARIIEQMQKVNSQCHNASLSNVLQNPHELIQHVIAAHRQTCMFPLERVRCLREAALQKGEFVNCPAHMACPLNANLASDPNDNSWEEFSEFFTPSIKSVVDFAKAIPGFCILNQDDQVTLLKAATFEVLLVRLASLFDPDTNTMLFTIGKLFKRQPSSVATSAGFLLDSMFDFAERFNKLNLNDDEIALFSAVVLLSPDRPGLRNIEQIEKVQNKLTESLQNVINTNHRDDNTLFAKLLMKTTDLRTLNTLHSEKSIGQGKDGSDTEMMDYRVNIHDTLLDSRSEGSSPSDNSSVATSSASLSGYDLPATSMEGSGAPVMPHRMPMDTQGHQQVVLKTPYGTFYREESFYGLVPDQPRRRCHTLDRETVTRPRLHTIEEGSRRRNTLDRDYINKMVNKLSDRLEKRAAIRGDSMPPSICNSAASSPIPEEFQHYMNRNHEFIPISTPADSSACSSRASPLINRDALLPYASSPSSPNPRSRSGSMGADDFGSMRRRCYSFHMNSDGRAARGAAGLHVQGVEQERISPDEYQSSLMPELRRGSVGAAYGLHVRKKSLLVDRHPAYLSRLSDTIKKKAEERHLLDTIGSNQVQHVGEGSSAFDSVSTIRIPVPCRPNPKSNWHQVAASTSQAQPPAVVISTDTEASKPVLPSSQGTTSTVEDLEEPMSPMAVDCSTETVDKNSSNLSSGDVTPAVFHKKFDKIRKHTIKTESEAAKNEEAGDKIETSPLPTEGLPQFKSLDNKTVDLTQEHPLQPKMEKTKLSAGEAHPQLLAHLKSPSRVVAMPTVSHAVNVPSHVQQPNNMCLPVNMQSPIIRNGLSTTLPDMNCGDVQVSATPSGHLHATTMSHLKDKLMRKFDSMENLNKIGPPSSSSQHSASIENAENIAKQQLAPTNESQNVDKNDFQVPMMAPGQVPTGAMYNHSMYPNSVQGMHPAFLSAAAYNSMHMVPGYNQHLAGMQQLAQLYGGHRQIRVSQEGQPLNLTRMPSAAAGSALTDSLLRGDNSRQPSALEQALSERKIKEEVSS